MVQRNFKNATKKKHHIKAINYILNRTLHIDFLYAVLYQICPVFLYTSPSGHMQSTLVINNNALSFFIVFFIVSVVFNHDNFTDEISIILLLFDIMSDFVNFCLQVL